jgi:hypothetical protein
MIILNYSKWDSSSMKKSGLRRQRDSGSPANPASRWHKKTTHALHRRFALTSGLSTADVFRLPNRAGFRIRGGSKIRSQNYKSSPSTIQKSQLTPLMAFNLGWITPGGVSYLSHIQSQSVNAGGHGGPPLRKGFGSTSPTDDIHSKTARKQS